MFAVRERLRRLADVGQSGRDRWMEEVAARVPPDAVVLDVGAGPCRYRSLFHHCHYVAHDFAKYEGTQSGIHRDAWAYGRLDFIADIVALPVRSGAIDAIICTEVLEHVPDPATAIFAMARCLPAGGQMYLSAPLRSGLHQQPFHFFGGFTPYFYDRVFKAAGLETVSITPVGGLFSSLAEDSIRAGRVLIDERYPGRWHPGRWASRAVLQVALPLAFDNLDQRHFHAEFTSDFLVEATKSRAGT